MKNVVGGKPTTPSILEGLKAMKKSLETLAKMNFETLSSALHNFGKESVAALSCRKR